MIKVVCFDLIDTLIKTTNFLKTDRGPYEIYRSLKKDGISIDWSPFANKYDQIRNKQKVNSKQTLKEYDMSKRVSETLQFFN